MFAWLARPLNLLALGPDSAESRGLDVARAQRAAFLSASLATGAAVSIGGPIGFVGIIIPHLVRLLVGPDHRLVLPASALFGAAFLVGCDLVARTILAPVELPVGIITALIGGPFFLWLLITKTLNGGSSGLSRCARTVGVCRRPARPISSVATSPDRRGHADHLAGAGASPRCSTRSAPAPASSAVSSYDTYPARGEDAAAASARCSIRTSSASCR